MRPFVSVEVDVITALDICILAYSMAYYLVIRINIGKFGVPGVFGQHGGNSDGQLGGAGLLDT